MTQTNKEKIISNSLLFFLLIDSLPTGTAHGNEYTIHDFNRDRDKLIKSLYKWLNSIENNEEEILRYKETINHQLFEDMILVPLNNKLKEIIKKDYYQYFKSYLTKELRNKILKRDKYICQYCGLKLNDLEKMGFSAHVDHIKSRRAGGKHNPENLVACCWKCNLGKKDFDLFEYEDDNK